MSDYLVDTSSDGDGNSNSVALVKCPICDEQLADPDAEGQTYNRGIDDHIASHDPEDLGLDDYQFRPMADILIELHGLGRETEEAL
jgi:hypothetical protein